MVPAWAIGPTVGRLIGLALTHPREDARIVIDGETRKVEVVPVETTSMPRTQTSTRADLGG